MVQGHDEDLIYLQMFQETRVMRDEGKGKREALR